MSVKVDQSKPSLAEPGKPIAGPPPSAPAVVAPDAVATPAYSEKWTESIIRYFCGLAAAEWGPEMAATEIEIQLLTPPLMAVLNRHAPDVASGADERASVMFVGLVLVIMGARRGLIVRRKARQEGQKAPGGAEAEQKAEKPAQRPQAPPQPKLTVVPPPEGTIMGGLMA